MTDATAPAPTDTGPVLAADGTPLHRSLARALRRQKLRAFLLVLPLLLFILVTFILPIGDMLFRSVENQIVGNTLPQTVRALKTWNPDGGDIPEEPVYRAMFHDLFLAAEAKEHTKLGTRLNYEQPGISSLFRTSGRKMDDVAKPVFKELKALDKSWDDAEFWRALMQGDGDADPALMRAARDRIAALEKTSLSGEIDLGLSAKVAEMLPATTRAYADFAAFTALVDRKSLAKEEPWEAVHAALLEDFARPGAAEAIAAYTGPGAETLRTARDADIAPIAYREALLDLDKSWGELRNWRTIRAYAGPYTNGYFLASVDMEKTAAGPALKPEDQRIHGLLFWRTMYMSLAITASCILLGYPVAWILANLPARKANLLMILVLLPFWTSLLVRTSAWKVMLQQQGVINDVLVWLGLVADDARLVMINNQTGTIIAMTHILLPFMILPMYSVMQTIPPSYLRAAKSLGANNWTAFWRVYFPQSVPGIGAGSILVFILAIGYYITPALVGGTSGIFISNRIAYHISSSLNWGLAAALGAILLAVVLVLYWAYDKIVGIDNVKLG